MKTDEIDIIEKKYNIQFTPDHRAFLEILHSIDRREHQKYTKTFEEDAEVFIHETSFFYHWQRDEKEMQDALTWPYESILQDILGVNKVWLKSWGEQPSSDKEKEEIFASWYQKAPKLLPLFSHRLILSDPCVVGNPVFSVWGSDTIVYGWNLRHYLLHELEGHLGILMDEADQWEKEYEALKAQMFEAAKSRSFPYWEDIITIWNYKYYPWLNKP